MKKLFYNKQAKTLFINGTKTKTSKRTIPVFPPLAELLNKLINENPNDKRIFCLSDATLKRHHLELMQRSGIKFTIKSLRHTYNQMLKEMKVPGITRAAWMGHSTPATTNRIYTHNTEVLQEQSIETVLQNLEKYTD